MAIWQNLLQCLIYVTSDKHIHIHTHVYVIVDIYISGHRNVIDNGKIETMCFGKTKYRNSHTMEYYSAIKNN